MITAWDENAAPVVQVRNLSRRFGAKRALNDVSLEIPRGLAIGLVGANGAGKTTLIRHLLGLLKAQAGTVRVFGLDPVNNPVDVLSRVGYLSEEGDLPDWMRIHELMRYLQAFYPTWDAKYADQLRRQFELDSAAKVRNLSKGQKARVGLVAALAYRPDLLVLDEPSSGLDPIVRRDILGAIVRTIADEGRTVLFSSHLLDEVERISDRVVMLKDGCIQFAGDIDAIRSTHHRLTLRFDVEQELPPRLDGAFRWERHGHEWTATARGAIDALSLAASALGAEVVAQESLSLDEIFLAHTAKPSELEIEVAP